MADNTGTEVQDQEITGNNDLRQLSFTELASMLHGLLFAYEKVFINLYGDDARQLYPYIIDELSHILHSGDNPIIDNEKNLKENLERVIHFISNEEYIKDIDLKKVGEGKYVFKIGTCTFAKSGVHDILKIKEGICPFALVIASCLTELTPDGYAKIVDCEFDDNGSKTQIELAIMEDEEGEREESLFKSLTKTDEKLFDAPTNRPPLDEMDLKIIKELRRDGRQSNVDIAKIVKTNESTVRRRINSLVERGIIRGFTTLLRYAPGETILRAFIGIKVDPKHIDRISSKLANTNETCSVYRSIGKHNLICEAIFMNRAKFQEFIDALQYIKGVVELEYSIASSAPKPCPWYGF